MSSAHSTVNFRNSCVRQPRNPLTKLPVSLLERESIDFANLIGTGRSSISRNYGMSHEKVLRSFEPSDSVGGDFYGDEEDDEEKKDILQTSEEDLKNLINDDDRFLAHLRALKVENKKTLKSLEKLYDMTVSNSKVAFADSGTIHAREEVLDRHHKRKKSSRRSLEKNIKKSQDANTKILTGEKLNKSIEKCSKNLLRASFQTDGDEQEEDFLSKDTKDKNEERPIYRDEKSLEERYSSSDNGDGELDEQLKVTAPESHVNILPDERLSSFRGRSSSFDVIANMWENFSVDEYVPYASSTKDKNAKQPWSPTITIPEPFQMTIRDESKSKRKSKPIEKIEQEKLEKRLQEEMELQKRIRPTPVPPTTFLPLYDEIAEKEDHRRKYVRDLSRKILQSTEKPFSFMKREEVKKEMKRARSMNDVRKQKQVEGERTKFKANPFPEKLFDLTWADKLAEQEEYRKIKIKLRSEETLAGSSLPMNMKTRAGTARYFQSGEKTKRTREGLKKRKQKSFQPQVHHKIPDFEVLHRKIDEELEQRKTVNPRTVCEPFDLQTEKIPKRRSKFVNSVMKGKEEEYVQSPDKERGRRRVDEGTRGDRTRSLSWSRISQQTPPVFSETETSKLRQERLRQSLDRTKQEELRLSIKLNKKRNELNKLQMSVAKKAIAQDPSRNRKKENKQKLAMFRMADTERRKEYKEYLHDVNNKLKERPLLFEREAENNARTKAQKRYEQILKEAGIEGDTLNSFLEGDVSERERYGDSDDDNDGSYVQDSDEDSSRNYSDDGITHDDGVSNDGSFIADRTSSSHYDDDDNDNDDEENGDVD